MSKKVVIDVFPTGICGCGHRQHENVELFKLLKEALNDFKDQTEINIMEYGSNIDKAYSRLNEILVAGGDEIRIIVAPTGG